MGGESTLVIIVIGIALIAGGLIGLLHNYYARRDGIAVIGRVVDHEFRTEDGHTTQFPIFEFTDKEGRLCRETMDAVPYSKLRIGETMSLFYNPVSTVTIFPDSRTLPMVFGLMLTTGIVILAVLIQG